MHRHSTLTHPQTLFRRVSRGARVAAVTLSVLVMAGCATKNTALSYNSEIDPFETEWTASADDPIGLLVTHRLKRERQREEQAPFATDSVLVAEALNQLGIRYRFGGGSPDTGFDCSGLVAYSAQRSLGLKLPRNSADIANQGKAINKDELRPGDLVFFNTLGRRYSHVGIYMGDNRFVHSPSAGGVVRVESMTLAYWSKRYNGARRIDRNARDSARASAE